MKTTVRTVGEVSVVDLSGKITIGEGDIILRDKVHELLEGGHKKILLNLEKVSYMDSAGIGELVACFKRAREKGGTVKLLKPSGKVEDLLQLTKLWEVFEIFGEEQQAIPSF
ncbi:MAG TPA: STAS domain-containing protein [Candidatus Polarisedimenticolaceae bacterium]|nr:STAS domain-containing protein [Candidatus Polarisedimenticolaceae bacterium]